MRQSSAIALACWLALACRPGDPACPTGVATIEPVELPPLTSGCEGRMHGRLSAERGQLVFWPADSSPPVLLRRGTDEWFSTLLPGADPDKVIAIRTIYGEQHVEGRDELIELTPGTMATRVLWAPERRLLLLGRTDRSVVMLGYDGEAARVIQFDLDASAIVESAPIDLDLDALAIRADTLHRAWRLDPVDGGNDWSTCRAANEYVLRCRGRLCLARVEDEGIRIADVELEPCPEPDWQLPRGLPVDGRMVHDLAVEVDACKVRTKLEFPSLGSDDPCHVELVDRGGPETMPWFRELHVGPGCTLSTGFSEFAFALPPEQVEIEPLPDRGRWRVRLPFPDSAFDDGDCRQGQLWLRRLDWSSGAAEENRLDWDYGFCE
jgi:hypothetical protein